MNPHLLQQTVHGVRMVLFVAKVLILSLNYKQFQTVFCRKNFPGGKTDEFFLAKFIATCLCC